MVWRVQTTEGTPEALCRQGGERAGGRVRQLELERRHVRRRLLEHHQHGLLGARHRRDASEEPVHTLARATIRRYDWT